MQRLQVFYHHPLIVDLIAVNGGDGVIHDITGTTVYVVAVICVIPVAGLVAWVVRYVVKKKVRMYFIYWTSCHHYWTEEMTIQSTLGFTTSPSEGSRSLNPKVVAKLRGFLLGLTTRWLLKPVQTTFLWV